MSLRVSEYGMTARCLYSLCFAAFLGVGVTGLVLGAPLADLFELDGNILDEPPLAPDWASLFLVDSAPDGDVIGPSFPLPGDGIIAGFQRDELAISGLDKTDCSVFASGNKNDDLIADWEFKSGRVPSKDDLSNVMAFLRSDSSGNLELYLALERYAENGDSHIDFEINQSAVGLTVDTPALGCPGEGHFTGERQPDDLLVAVDFERGGDIGLVRIYRYVNASDLELLIEETVDTTDLFCNAATTAGGIGIPAGTICVINNNESIDGGPWANFNRSDRRSAVQTLPKNAFTEVGIRLGGLPGALSTTTCLRTITIKTRSSQAITSDLKDFVLIEVEDVEAPVVNCSADVTINCEDPIPLGEAAATDNCDSDVSISLVELVTSGACPPEQTITRTWTATDAAGNSSDCVQVVTVVDVTVPTIDNGSADDVNVDSQCSGTVNFRATITDNCCVDEASIYCEAASTDVLLGAVECEPTAQPNGSVLVTGTVPVSHPTVCPGTPGTVTVTVYGNDCCGHPATDLSFNAHVTDNSPPDLTCPPELTAWNYVECNVMPNFGYPTVWDNCGADPLIEWVDVEFLGDCLQPGFKGGVAGVLPPPKYHIERDYSVSDGQQTLSVASGGLGGSAATCTGNVATCTQGIDVVDTIPPEIDGCPSGGEVACGEPLSFAVTTLDGSCSGTVTPDGHEIPDPIIECTFADDADPDRFESVSLPDGSYELTLTATTTVTAVCTSTDECNNQSGCEFVVWATCNEACSPGFWRNNLNKWCLTPFIPFDGHCLEGSSATLFLDAFGLEGCDAPETSSFHEGMTLYEAVSSAGGTDQTFFHGSAALLNAHSVSFPAEISAVEAVMRDACSGGVSTDFDGQPVSWDRAFNIFTTWNAAEADGGCPLVGVSPASAKLHQSRSSRR